MTVSTINNLDLGQLRPHSFDNGPAPAVVEEKLENVSRMTRPLQNDLERVFEAVKHFV